MSEQLPDQTSQYDQQHREFWQSVLDRLIILEILIQNGNYDYATGLIFDFARERIALEPILPDGTTQD